MIRTKQIIKRMYVPGDNASKQEILLCDVLNKSEKNLSQLADACHVSKQCINFIAHGRVKITFPMLCAICYTTGIGDPEDIWKELNEGRVNIMTPMTVEEAKEYDKSSDCYNSLVRCKDCKKWSEESNSYYGRCEQIRRLTPFDWFCADGELR